MKITDQNISNNLHRFKDVYPVDGSENQPPEKLPIIAFCSNDEDVIGWATVDCVSDLGLERLILQKWISQEDFKKL